MTDRELLQQALDALISVWNMDKTTKQVESIQAIKARLAQPEKEWVGLTDEEVHQAYKDVLSQPIREQDKAVVFNVCRAIEANLKEKNT
jgi:hypothetical protein